MCLLKTRLQLLMKVIMVSIVRCAQICKLFVSECELCIEDAVFDDQLCTKAVERIIGLAATRVRNLDKMWKSEEMSKDTKMLLYEMSMLSQLFYNSKTWTLKKYVKRS